MALPRGTGHRPRVVAENALTKRSVNRPPRAALLMAGAETPAWYLRCQRGLGGRGWGLRHVAPLAGNSASSATHNRPPSMGDTSGAVHVRQVPRRTWHCRRPYCHRYLWASRLHSLHPRTPVLLKSSLSGVAVVTRPEETRVRLGQAMQVVLCPDRPSG